MISPYSDLVKPYLNKIHMMRSSPDLPYMTLDGPDLDPSRDHVFHLTFPPDWKHVEIYQLFKNYGQIIIGWIDDTHGIFWLVGVTLLLILLAVGAYWRWMEFIS